MTLTLPLQAVDIDGDGQPWFPFQTGSDGAILFAATPVLPVESFTWAVLPDDDRPHIVLDETALAELLFCSGLDPVVPLDEDTLLGEIARQLAKCRCDTVTCARRFGEACGDHLDTYCDRMAWCLYVAAHAIGGAL